LIDLMEAELHSESIESVDEKRWLNLFSLWCIPIALLACAFYAYSHTLTARYTYDAISYAYQIREFERTGEGGWLAHPHHLLFNPLGYLTHQILQFAGMELDSLLALQFMNTFLAACGLVLLYLIGIKGGFFLKKPVQPVLKATPLLVLGIALLFGSAYGYWACATDGRVNMPALVSFIATTGVALGMLYAPSARQCLLLAGFSVLTTSLHQSYGLFVVGGVSAILLALTPSWRESLRYVVLYLFVFGLGLLTVYLSVGLGVKGARSVQELQQWAFAYAHDGRWWNTDLEANLPLNLHALQHAFVSELPSPSEGEVEPVVKQRILWMDKAVTIALCVALGLLPVLLLFAFWKRAVSEPLRSTWRPFVLFPIIALPFTAFFTVWNPGYFVFWMPAACLLVFYLLFLFALLHRFMQVLLAALSISAAFLLAHTNLEATLLRRTHRENNPYLMLCERLNEHTQPGDLLLLSGMEALAPLDIYASYFTELKVVSLNSVFKQVEGQAPAVVQNLRSLIREQMEDGKQVILLDEFTGPAVWRELKKRYGADRQTALQILYGYRLQRMFKYRTTDAFEVELNVEYFLHGAQRLSSRSLIVSQSAGG